MSTLADSAIAAEISATTIGMSLVGGLALFLFGLEQMTDALKLVAGDRMKSLLARLTTNRFKAVFAGAFVTSVIQSSSVTTVLLVGFISAGLMSLQQSIGVIIGANIGTTVTAQIVAFKVTKYALVPVAFGFGLLFFTKSERLRHYGHVIMGLGLVFFGMEMMSSATGPLSTYQPFQDLMIHMEHPLVGILVGAAFTAVVQSSSATTTVIILLARHGLSLEAGIALAFGANIGTCVTAVLASIGKPRAAMQATLVHILFNVAGVIVWFGFIDQLASLVRWLSSEPDRQIANAHTVFNVVNALLFIGLTGPMAIIVRWVVPEGREAKPEPVQPRYLDDLLIQAPAVALDMVRMELGRLGTCVVAMVRRALAPVIDGTRDDLRALEKMDDDVDRLHAALINYLAHLSQETLTSGQSERLHDYLSAANYLENIGDMVETNLVEAGTTRLDSRIQMSVTTRDVLRTLHVRVVAAVEQAVQALVDADQSLAGQVVGMKDEINKLAADAERHLSQRLTAAAPNRLAAFRIESELIEYLKRVYYFAKRIAKIATDVETQVPSPMDESSATHDTPT